MGRVEEGGGRHEHLSRTNEIQWAFFFKDMKLEGRWRIC